MVKRCLLFIACLCALVSADEAELTRQANQVYPRVSLIEFNFFIDFFIIEVSVCVLNCIRSNYIYILKEL